MKYVICAYFAHINPDIPTFYKFPDGYMNSDMVFGPIDEAL